MEYLQKSKHLQEQLKEMRTEIEVLKIGENQTLYDHIHDEQVNLGENKYSTFRKVSVGDGMCVCLAASYSDFEHRSY